MFNHLPSASAKIIPLMTILWPKLFVFGLMAWCLIEYYQKKRKNNILQSSNFVTEQARLLPFLLDAQEYDSSEGIVEASSWHEKPFAVLLWRF